MFLSSSIDRELQAVHSEFEGYLSQDAWRIRQVKKTTSDPEHPYSKFNVGNIETLRTTPAGLGIDVREVLLQFYENQYSANRMSLAVLGNRKYCVICVVFNLNQKIIAESLDKLQSMVVRSFENVVNKQLTIPRCPADPFGETRCKVDCSIIFTLFSFFVFPFLLFRLSVTSYQSWNIIA